MEGRTPDHVSEVMDTVIDSSERKDFLLRLKDDCQRPRADPQERSVYTAERQESDLLA